ncbi:MAG: SGNH/GDSL hydrolase family protein [Chryseosolibacter sp.]
MMICQLLTFVLLFAGMNVAEAQPPVRPFAEDSIRFQDAHDFSIIGKYHGEKNYVRFPGKYKNSLRESVWNLGQHSAGISIRFRTNATTIMVRCTVLNDAGMSHMPATGVKGLDLYAHNGSGWQYVRTGIPKGKQNEYTLLNDGDGAAREYLLNLPLYDGVESLEIGVNEDAEITKPVERFLLDARPVVYYGTSIAQGGCASRPGLAFTNILSRSLDRSFINFGFSGNGTIETSVGEAMCEIDAALYVIDCNANTKSDLIYERTIALVQMLRKRRPGTPVLLVEGFMNESFYFNPASGVNEDVTKKQQELNRAYQALKKAGVKDLYYRKGEGLIGSDHEGTVDGIHPNDIGMMRIADALLPVMKRIL